VIDFLKQNRDAEALTALNRLDIARLNELMVIFTRFIKVCGREFYFIFSHISNVTEANGEVRVFACQQTYRNFHANCIRAPFTNKEFERHIRLPTFQIYAQSSKSYRFQKELTGSVVSYHSSLSTPRE
jgi:hypothetical protein